MKLIVTIFIILTFGYRLNAQTKDCAVVLNHILIVLDSTTYQAIVGSEIFTNNFAFAYERKKNWEGFYIIGQKNYIEFFHPKSVEGEDLPIGFTWICQTSMEANCIKNYVVPTTTSITYSSDEYFDEVSLLTRDSSALFTTQEMNKEQYESWTKKTYNDSIIFVSTDYNSPAETDSAKNYLFNSIIGIRLAANPQESQAIIQYLSLIGYRPDSIDQNCLKYTNGNDFIELDYSPEIERATISCIYFTLNTSSPEKRISIGNTELQIEGNQGKWIINGNQ